MARVVARCSRCAGAFEVPVDREFEVLYESFDSGAVSRAGGLDASDLPLDYYEGDAIDGHRLLAEQILLALPMKLLCDEDCRGLCPVCGADLNHTRCGCETEIDSRLAPLKAIREQL